MPRTRHRLTVPREDVEVEVQFDWAIYDGQPEPDRWEVVCVDGGPVTAGITRYVGGQSGRLIREDRAKIIKSLSKPGGRRVASRTRTEHLKEVARVYTDAFERGDPPVKAVMAHFRVGRGTATNWVSDARKARILPPTKPGVAHA